MSKIKDFLKSPLGTALCAVAACLLAVVLVWLAAVRPNNDKSLSERISDDYSQYSAELDKANGPAQPFDTDNDLLAMAFVFGTSNGQPTGELHLELADADTGEVLARSTGDMANIVAGQYTGMGLDTPVTGSAGRRHSTPDLLAFIVHKILQKIRDPAANLGVRHIICQLVGAANAPIPIRLQIANGKSLQQKSLLCVKCAKRS